MAAYTELSKEDLFEILACFGVYELKSFKVLSGGSENSNYLVQSSTEKFVLTICEQKTADKARELATLLQHLEDYQFRSSKIIPAKNQDSISLWQNKPVMLKTFLEGKILEHLPNTLLAALGRELAKLHKVPAPKFLPGRLNFGKEQFYKVEEYAADTRFAKWLNEQQSCFSSAVFSDLPKAFIHADIFSDNVIVDNAESKVVIMDFEEAANYFRVFDIGMTIIGTCSENNQVKLERAHHLLQGYMEEIQLLSEEKLALQAMTVYAGTAMTFWRHINFNYWNPIPGFSDHYLGLKVLADYIRNMQPEYFYQQLFD